MTPCSPGRPESYSANINGFRGVCVLLVFVHHVANSGLPPRADAGSLWQTALYAFSMSLGYGVELFFMISGYVIVKSLRRHETISGFLRDRVLRIFPVWVPIALCLCLVGAASSRPGFEAAEPLRWLFVTVANLLLLPPLLPIAVAHPASWSLSYEWLFYLASALAAWLWQRPATPVVAKLAWGAAVILLLVCFPRGLYFLPGVLVALSPKSVSWLRGTAGWAWLSLPLFLVSWYSTGIFAAEYDKPLWSVVLAGHGPAVLVAFAAATHLFASVAVPDGSAALGVLRSAAVQHLGTISYSFYLVHPLAMAVVKQGIYGWIPDARGSWTASLVFALASALLAWALSWLCWRWLEQRLARWLRSRREPEKVPLRSAPPPLQPRQDA